MKHKMKYSFLICIFIIAGLSMASEENQMLTLEQCVDIALENNPDLNIAEKEWKKAKAGIWEAYSMILPSLDAHATFQKSWDIQTNAIPNFIKEILKPSPGIPITQEFRDMLTIYTDAMPDVIPLSFGLENTLMYGATLNQPLFLGGAGIAGIKMANSTEKAARENYESIKQNLIYRVSDAFYQTLLAKKLVEVQEEAFKQAMTNLDMVKKRYEVGSASGFDKMRAEVEVANLKPELITAKNNYQASLTHIRMLLGIEKKLPIDIQGEMKFVYDDYGTLELSEIQNRAMQNRPEVSVLFAQKKIAASGVTLVRSQFMPKLYFSTDYSFLAMRNNYDFAPDDFSKGFTSALSLQIPIFHGFKNCKQYQKARLDYKISSDMEKQLLDGIKAEVEIAYNKFQEAKEKYQAATESIDMAEEAMRLANLTYEEGASTQLDVLNSQLALTRARLNHASALYEYQMARYQIRKVTGQLNDIL
ncbi:TolC family protein [bacterium]|nr:TolC family protein [bacterium]